MAAADFFHPALSRRQLNTDFIGIQQAADLAFAFRTERLCLAIAFNPGFPGYENIISFHTAAER